MRVLQLCPFPIEVPRHGGQARCSNVRAVLNANSCEVRTLAVYEPESYGGEAVGSYDIAFPINSRFRKEVPPLCLDFAAGDFLSADEGGFPHLRRVAERFPPDVILIEHVWLWPAANRLRAALARKPAIVYDSHNNEAPLKREVLAGMVPASEISKIAERIARREREAALAADLCIACTADDAIVLRSHGATQVIIAPNGIVERRVDPGHFRDWEWFLRDRRFALFVGSAYPLNAVGFWNMYGPSLAFLAPDQRILAVGGVCGLLTEHPMYRRWAGINSGRLDTAGIQSEEALAALIQLSSCIVLPITSGGGSNIKTAEAIQSGRPVIGTTKAFRGYEFALRLPHIYAVDDSSGFRQLTRAAIEGKFPASDAVDDPELRNSVLWKNALAHVPTAISALRARLS